MLTALSIRDFVIVESLELDFAPGFSVLSGETGAGKSILIDALSLALGERGDAGVVRAGRPRADITASFVTHEPARAWLIAHELEDDGAALLRRSVDAAGRSKAWINGTPVTLAQLRELGELLVDIHGQHAHQSLLRPAEQRRLLDHQGGHESLADEVAAAYRDWKRLAEERERVEHSAQALAEERDRVAFQVAELDKLALEPGEWTELDAEHQRLAHAASLIEGAQSAVDTLDEAEGAVLGQLAGCANRLGHLAQIDARLKNAAETLESARIQVQEAVYELNDYLGRVEVDPARLAVVEARIAAAHELARKLRCEPEALPERRTELTARLATLAAAADLDELKRREQAAAQEFEARARVLTTARERTALALSRAVTDGMQTLAMAGGRFAAVLQPCPPSAHGLEDIEFQVAAHPGASLRPLARVASGGELARISLAIAVVASAASPIPTLIFDEVDSGVGGAVAEVVGRLLRQLGQMRQVLCVTHLPQVAAQGQHHFAVRKVSQGESTTSEIHALSGSERVDELARMLGGIDITATTRKHARELLAQIS